MDIDICSTYTLGVSDKPSLMHVIRRAPPPQLLLHQNTHTWPGKQDFGTQS